MAPLLMLFLSFQGPPGALCPPTLKVNQQLAEPIPGWAASPDGVPNQLSGVTFFGGPPEQKASLAPDKETKTDSTWYFTKPSWLACHYSGTSLMLTKQLPKGTHSCTVTFRPGEFVAGLPAIQKIECK